jgi:outer membrane receptor protein involved in Fe transport
MSRLLSALLTSSLALPAAAAQPPAPPAGQPAGQPPSFEIRGRIVDTANAPIPRASVSLRLKANGLTVAGALAGRDGTFRMTGLRPGRFSIRVAYIGYAPVIQDVTLAPNTPVLDLGVAKLAPMAATLSAVTVKEERAAVVAEPDRNAYRTKDLAPGAANASELLEHVPSVQVDVDGKVSLRGNENVVVQINGRPTPMRGAQLAAYLKTLSANVIDRIEVIPNPSAKYDPEGMAGIINVALKSNVDLGLSGAVNAAVSDADRYNTSGNLGYQSGPWSTFVSAGVVSDHRSAVGVNDRERYDAASALESVTGQDILLRPHQRGQNLNATVDYKLSPRDVLSNALIVSHRASDEPSTTTQTLLSGAGSTLDQFVRPRDAEATGLMLDYDVAFKRTLAPRAHELSTELRFNRAHDEDVNDERRLTGGTGYTNGKIERNDAVTQQLTAQADYLKTLHKRTKLETGWKSTARWLDRDYAVTVDPAGVGAWAPSPLSNDLQFDEAVHAVYAVVSQGVKKWDLQAGLRGEYASRTFSLATQRYPYDYASLFPSAVASYTLAPNTTLKSSYSRRIRRPGAQELNPFPNYFDADNVFFGNPDLRPEYTDALELGLTKSGRKGMVQLSPFYRRTGNVIRIDINTTDTLDTREVTSISYRNLAHSNSWGSDLTGQLRLSPRFTALTNFSLFKLVTDGGSTSALGSDAIGWMGRINVTSELTKTLTVQAAYNYRAPMKIERGEFGAQQIANVALRMKVQGDRGAVLLRVADPFEMMRFRIRTGDGKVLQLTERNPQSRVAFVGYQYNFGRPPRVRQVAPEQTGGGSVGFGTPGS